MEKEQEKELDYVEEYCVECDGFGSDYCRYECELRLESES